MSTPGDMLREARARFSGGDAAATRVYRGRSVDELVPQIQRELGDDAIIVRRREGLTGGVLGFFQRAFVEIEAMRGAPGVDVYDEDAAVTPSPAPGPGSTDDLAARANLPPHADFAARADFAPQADFAVPSDYAPPPVAPTPGHAYAAGGEREGAVGDSAPVGGERPPVAGERVSAIEDRSAPNRFMPEHSSAPPVSPAPPTVPARPRLGYAPTPPAPTLPAPGSPPPPFYAREHTPPNRAGSAYVTAHLAALARADRARVPPRARAPERRDEQREWSPDFHELTPARAPEPLASPGERTPAQPWAASERRVVAPGSHGRARAGVARSLQRCGIGQELTDELIDGASAHALALAPRGGLAQAVRATLAQRLPVAPPLPTKGAAIVVVGAGGAGKTTCCAALLGAYRRGSSLQASFATITREPERGELQMILSPYIMKPSSARAPRALRALRRARDDGMTILDTPSLSPSDRAGVRELARLLGEVKPERVVVALPATLGATAAAQLLQALKPLGANALAVTHADETDQLGVAVEAACRFGLAPEYMLERARTGGWRLRQIEPSALVERLLP